ncbi:type II toxin-antitoxin system RelE/ParE family toxin [Stenotrophomonas geniculata]|uniref:type II toxin-antitoxin system RelE/ParE family toxin n=1 Tax=Stenotrophomonas geniculata TaxID=86188 RepID=UPI001F532671|nr:type II toxin-antitoxin system RelE/ParE family toxin [Stenotrophomonas geniculata]MCI1121460.1 type II toxin-antitoxin system RelE/ParE family toxin [Stenotrophomonas maltophilia]
MRGREKGTACSARRRRCRVGLFIWPAFLAKRRVCGLPGNRLHPLHGSYSGYWAVNVSASWRLVFRFRGLDVELVDYLDYH